MEVMMILLPEEERLLFSEDREPPHLAPGARGHVDTISPASPLLMVTARGRILADNLRALWCYGVMNNTAFADSSRLTQKIKKGG